MPKKLLYEDVKKFIDEKSNHECELISKEYTGNTQKLELKCKCGKTFFKNFMHIKDRLGFLCNDCLIEKNRKRMSFDMERVIKIIEDGGCEYISGEYVNTKSKLKLRCKCGNIFERDLNHYLRGRTTCTKCSNKKLSNSKTKYTLDDVKKILSKSGYTVLDDTYYHKTKLKCVCKRGHYVEIHFLSFLCNRSGCDACARIEQRGKGHWNYKGGESEIIDYFRKLIKEWKKDILKKYNYKCFLTGASTDLVIHHLVSFSNILKETIEELNLEMRRKIKDYSEHEFEMITNKFLEKHTTDIGVVLSRKVHNKFHNIYGMGNNTKEQFDEFINNFYKNKE